MRTYILIVPILVSIVLSVFISRPRVLHLDMHAARKNCAVAVAACRHSMTTIRDAPGRGIVVVQCANVSGAGVQERYLSCTSAEYTTGTGIC